MYINGDKCFAKLYCAHAMYRHLSESRTPEYLYELSQYDGLEYECILLNDVQWLRKHYRIMKAMRRVAKLILLKKYGWSFVEA